MRPTIGHPYHRVPKIDLLPLVASLFALDMVVSYCSGLAPTTGSIVVYCCVHHVIDLIGTWMGTKRVVVVDDDGDVS